MAGFRLLENSSGPHKQQGFENSLLNHNQNKGEDKFKGVFEGIDGRKQLKYGQEIGLGCMKYDLINLGES